MKTSKEAIQHIIDEMLDNPGAYHVYNTARVCNKLEELLKQVRIETAKWTFLNDCINLNKDIDPRNQNVYDMLKEMLDYFKNNEEY